MERFRNFRFGFIALIIVTYSLILLVAGESKYQKDSFLSKNFSQKNESIGLDLYTQQVNIDQSLLRITAIPRLSGSYGENTSNGAFLETPIAFSFDVYEGNTLVNPGAGSLMSGQNLALNLKGSPMNYPFDSYDAQFYVSIGIDNYNADAAPLNIADKTKSVAGFKIHSEYLSFVDETTKKQNILMDIKQGTGLIHWDIHRSNSTILAVFLFGALMLVGAVASLLMTLNVVKGNRPPSINSLTWLAAFLFALFQVRNQLPGDPPSGVRFDLMIFYPVILLLIVLIMINVTAWNTREDWDMENPVKAVRGERI